MAIVKIVTEQCIHQKVVERIAVGFAKWLEANAWKIEPWSTGPRSDDVAYEDLAALFAEDAEEKGIG